jgi:hypothetical protein
VLPDFFPLTVLQQRLELPKYFLPVQLVRRAGVIMPDRDVNGAAGLIRKTQAYQ